MSKSFDRREFLKITSSAALAGGLLIGCSQTPDFYVPPLLDQAPDGPELKAGLVGCGGRGTGAAIQFVNAGPNLTISALGDVFEDRLNRCRDALQEQVNVEVPEDQCYLGFDAYQQVIDSDVDIVLLATPPHFRPQQFEAAVNARKHVFMEKPLAVDPVGTRSVMATAKKARNLGLNVMTGTNMRHSRDIVATNTRVREGMIGPIVSATVIRNGGQLWYRTPRPEWSEMEYMIRDWVNWCWLSGDHIVEQHIHRIDQVHFFTGRHPVSAVGYGARQRRVTGDQYDMFSIDYEYEDGVRAHCATRQINGCSNKYMMKFQGTRGYTNGENTIYDLDGNVIWEYEYPTDESGQPTDQVKVESHQQEQIDMVTNIRNGNLRVDADETAISTMVAVMGRISAYTGREVTWEEMMSSDLRLGPTTYELGPVPEVDDTVPVPGTA
ncbi:MAG TPA: Gfo/Idh/MocA family oxidoreductase [bacterium]|nr:Gfo/Idh/MocA family oxidoreductase [bacterium]